MSQFQLNPDIFSDDVKQEPIRAGFGRGLKAAAENEGQALLITKTKAAEAEGNAIKISATAEIFPKLPKTS